jgi:deazaflavin-dependent oxidoreductase (nitroreductase family)
MGHNCNMTVSRPGPVLTRLFRAPVYLYRWHCGWLLGRRFVLLAHVGRKSGRTFNTVVEVVRYRAQGPEVVVMSGWGDRADWFLNIRAGGPTEVTIGRRHFVAAHRFLSEDEAVSVFEEYERRNRYVAPIVRSVLSRLLGWKYSGSSDDRRKVVNQLPLMALEPAAA